MSVARPARRRVAITGLGVVSPLGNDVESLFASLVAGHSGVVRIEHGERAHVGAAIRSFDGSTLFPAPRLRMLDRVSQFALAAANQALADSGLALDAIDRSRAGVYLGTGMGGAQSADDGYLTLYAQGSTRVQPYSVLMAMNNAAASWIGIDNGLSGPNLTYSTACSSSAVAIGEAFRRIVAGDVDVMFAGGSEAPLNLGTLVAWDAMKTLAPEDPEDAGRSCKPFAKNRSGLVLGEGAAIVVLEEWEHARARDALIHAELIGYGLATDATHITRPSVAGQARAMRLALESAQISLDAISYVNAHGTATLANDGVETAAIKEVFGADAYRIPVSSTKSMHGHLLGAAGALELVVTVLAIERRTLPPTINLSILDPECDLDYVAGAARPAPRIAGAMTNSFAFGGTNAVLVCAPG